MNRSELKSLIRETIQEMGKQSTSTYDVEIYLPGSKTPEAIITVGAKSKSQAIESAEETIAFNYEMKDDYPEIFEDGFLRQDLIFRVIKTA